MLLLSGRQEVRFCFVLGHFNKVVIYLKFSGTYRLCIANNLDLKSRAHMCANAATPDDT